MGCVLPAGQGQAPARQAALDAGCPPATGAITVNKVCGSGMRAVMIAANDLRCGDFAARRRGRHGDHVQRAVPRCRRRATACASATAS